MQHLITKTQISELSRPISVNIKDARADSFINEAEMACIKPMIGDALYIDLLGTINAPSAPYLLLLDGGQYVASDGSPKLLGGLRAAVAYYAYASIVKNNEINVTSYGVKTKDGEYSSSVDYKQLMRVCDDAIAFANRIMAEVIDFLKANPADYPLFKSATKTPEQISRRVTVKTIGE